MIRFIQDSPALLIEEESILVVGDLHIGLAYKIYKNGIEIPDQLPDIEGELLELLKKTKAKTLVILGDVKEEVPGINFPEMIGIPRFLDRLSSTADIHICRGNHDTHLEKVLSNKVILHPSGGFRMDDYFFFHGHEWPSEGFLECKTLILGHIHPVFEFKDKLDYKVRKPVWLKLKIKKKIFFEKYRLNRSGDIEMILAPSFNGLLGGYPINRPEEMGMISPILRSDAIDLNQAEVYLLDGTYLGELKELG